MGTVLWGRGGGGNSPATRDTKGSNNTSRREEMESEQEPAAPPSTPMVTAEGERGGDHLVSTQRHSDGADGARPEHSALACCEYGLLPPKDLKGDQAAARPQGSGDTMRTGGTYRRETGMEEQNGHCMLLARSHPEEEEEERGPPEQERTLNTCSHLEGGGALSSAHPLCAAGGWRDTTPTIQEAPPVCSQGTEELGAPPEKQRVILSYDLHDR